MLRGESTKKIKKEESRQGIWPSDGEEWARVVRSVDLETESLRLVPGSIHSADVTGVAMWPPQNLSFLFCETQMIVVSASLGWL